MKRPRKFSCFASPSMSSMRTGAAQPFCRLNLNSQVTEAKSHCRNHIAGPPAPRPCGAWGGRKTSCSQRLVPPNSRNLRISHETSKKIFPVFSTHLARPGKNTPDRYAILITVNQSNHKRSWINQEKQNCTLRASKNPQTLTFSVKNCNARSQSTETKRLMRLPRNHATTPSGAL